MAKAKDSPKPITKNQLFANIAEKTELSKKDVAAVFDALVAEVQSAVSKKGPGGLTIPGLVKVVRHTKPATKAQKNVPKPFSPGETYDKPAQPAKTIVKVRMLKSLKEMI